MENARPSLGSFFDHVVEGCLASDHAVFSGTDNRGRYEAEAFVSRESDGDQIIETRRYFFPSGSLRMIARVLTEVSGENVIQTREGEWSESFKESLVRTEEWNEDGSRHYITSYAGRDEWIWERVINHKTRSERLSINRDSFTFFNIPEDLIRSLEDGEFCPDRLREIRWEGVREAVLEILGPAKLVPGLPTETVDSLGSNRLLRMVWRDQWGAPRMDPWYFLELCCTSTGKISYLRVPPDFGDIMSAIAWTFGEDKEGYRLERET